MFFLLFLFLVRAFASLFTRNLPMSYFGGDLSYFILYVYLNEKKYDVRFFVVPYLVKSFQYLRSISLDTHVFVNVVCI